MRAVVAPTTVIVKCARQTEEFPYDPDDLTPGHWTPGFLRDWLGTQFLSAVPGDPPSGPRFYGGDRARGFFVIEDLGDGGSLADLLLGDDPARAEQGLLAFAAALGRMHAATIGQADTFHALCRALALAPDQVAMQTARDARADVRRLVGWCDALGVRPAPGFETDIEAACACIQSPGPFLAYTHGDPCPDNNRLTPDGLRLFDFEHGAFRHALFDGVYGRLPFPTCWCVNRLPPPLPAQMEAAYRAELAAACPEASDAATFCRETAAVCAAWLLTTMEWSFEETLQADRPWGISSLRQRIPLRLHSFADTAEAWGILTALGRTARDMAVRLEQLWGQEIEPMPLYPAFRQA
jgi:hypothetical protein